MVYMVEGLRYGMLGRSSFPPLAGGAILVGVAAVATGVVYAALRSGYKLKA
jgi:ABC-2 type transport system permease protein